MKTELDKFYTLIEDIEIAMMTTRRPDGHRPNRSHLKRTPLVQHLAASLRTTTVKKRSGSMRTRSVGTGISHSWNRW
jgi:hypothetical protein